MKKFLALSLLCVFIFGVALTVTADDGTRNITVSYGVNLNINGNYFVPTDVNGNVVPAFIYNGTTYVPIRAISELYGADVQWDNGTKTAYITYTDFESMFYYLLSQQQNTATYPTSETISVSFPLHLYSNDRKTYLGKCVTNEYDPDSIYYGLIGTYSSTVGFESIWNSVGTYGSAVSDQSAFNDIAMHPPIIVDNNGIFVAYLTTNKMISPGWTIARLRLFLEENGQ